jgi:hypothetical protein
MGHRSSGSSWERAGGIGIEFALLPMRVQPMYATTVCARCTTIGILLQQKIMALPHVVTMIQANHMQSLLACGGADLRFQNISRYATALASSDALAIVH